MRTNQHYIILNHNEVLFLSHTYTHTRIKFVCFSFFYASSFLPLLLAEMMKKEAHYITNEKGKMHTL